MHIFNQKVEAEGKPVTNQKSSGRCWIFACLNVMRYTVFFIIILVITSPESGDKLQIQEHYADRCVSEETEGRCISFHLI